MRDAGALTRRSTALHARALIPVLHNHQHHHPVRARRPPLQTGYYFSRPELKQLIHDASAFFRGASQLHALQRDGSTWESGIAQLLTLWRAVGVSQHHDTITGDLYDAVEDDTTLRLRAGINNAASVAGVAAAALTESGTASAGAACLNTTLAPCAALVAALESRSPVALTLYNPTAWARREVVHLIVPVDTVVVTDAATGAAIATQVAPFLSPDLPPGTWYSLVFVVPAIAPLGTAVVSLKATFGGATAGGSSSSGGGGSPAAVHLPTASVTLTNGNVSLTFTANGTLLSMAHAATGASVALSAKLMYYTSTGGHENVSADAAGALLRAAHSDDSTHRPHVRSRPPFCPAMQAWDFSSDGSATPLDFPGAGAPVILSLAQGPLFSELYVGIDAAEGVALRWRLYAGEDTAHVISSSGPFAAPTNASKDALLRLESSDIPSGASFFTDSNALELMPRVRWARPFTSVNYTNEDGNEPVAINQYPVTSAAVLAAPAGGAGSPALAVLTANSHAVTSMASGQLDVFMNRMVLDASGNRFTGNRLVSQHNLLAVSPSLSAATTASRRAAIDFSNPTLVFVSVADGVDSPAVPNFAPLSGSLPPQVHLLSLQLLPPAFNMTPFFGNAADAVGAGAAPVSSGSLLLRLRHVFQASLDDAAMAVPATVDLAALFAPRWSVTAATELVVDASQGLAEARKAQVQWQQQASASRGAGGALPERKRPTVPAATSALIVTLAPMEIRTYLLQLGA